MGGYNKVFILGLNSLEHDFVEGGEVESNYLKQLECGKYGYGYSSLNEAVEKNLQEDFYQ